MNRNRLSGATSGHNQLDDQAIEQILNGQATEADIPAEYASVSRLIRCAALSDDRVDNEAASVSALAFRLRAPAPSLFNRLVNSVRRTSLKVGLVTAAGVLSASGVAAAATNNLPASTQSAVSSAASHMGVGIPKPKSASSAPHPGAQTCHLAQQQPNANGCSAVAKANAPGQVKKATTSTTSVTTTGDANNAAGNGASHASTQGLAHGQGLQQSTTTTSTTLAPGKSGTAPGHQDK